MAMQIDLFPETKPLSFHARGSSFAPTVLAKAPDSILIMPDGTEEEKIQKAKAVLKWVMSRYKTAFSFSGGKDSSCVLGIAMAAAVELTQEGQDIKSFAVLTADTKVENPNVHAVAQSELASLRRWIKTHDLPGSVHVASPYLSAEFAVNIIGGRSLPSSVETKRDCTTDWKSLPLGRLRKQVLGTNDVPNGRFVVSVTGVRRAESILRATNMEIRGESADSIVQTNADGNVAIAPIAEWSWDDVFNYLGLARNGDETTYSDFANVIRVYREAMGECVITGSDDDKKASRPCSARTGCWTCLMVQDDNSMDQMLEEPGNAYMRPLADFRTFLSRTFYDLSRRTWVGRTIDANGYIRFAPDGYSPGMLQELLRYALTIQTQEVEDARRLGITPRFTIVSLEALIAIDAMWSLQGFAIPFTALKIYRDIERGARYPIPDIAAFPKVEIPKPRYIYCGTDWDQHGAWRYTGLRDVMRDAFGGEGCSGNREILSQGKYRTVMDVNTADFFSVDPESASLLLEFELDRLVDEWHGPQASQFLSFEGHHVAGAGYRFYLNYGTISLAKGHLGSADEILRRTAFRERLGLAGYQYNHSRALALSVEHSVPVLNEDAPAIRHDKMMASREAKRHMLMNKRINLVELYRDWAPDVSWRRLVANGVLPMPAIPRNRAGRLVLRHHITPYALTTFLRSNPLILDRVKNHRLKKSLVTNDLFALAA